jgi:hypothetical protein
MSKVLPLPILEGRIRPGRNRKRVFLALSLFPQRALVDQNSAAQCGRQPPLRTAYPTSAGHTNRAPEKRMEPLNPDSRSSTKSAPAPSGSAACAEQPPRPAVDSLQVPGVVIDHCRASSGRHIGSPSIAILPNGDTVASHDFFDHAADRTRDAASVVFSSTDKGGTWHKIADISPLFWGKLFVHRDALYILGTRHEYGDVLIRRSILHFTGLPTFAGDCRGPWIGGPDRALGAGYGQRRITVPDPRRCRAENATGPWPV